MKMWAELIPTMCGWAIAIDDNQTPVFYDTEAEVLEEIASMQADYDEQIEAGERDEDDEYEGECHLVKWDGDNLFIAETNEQINWREQL